MPGQDILRFQADCIRFQSIYAPFVLYNGRGFAQCKWLNAHLGLFEFDETGQVMHAESVPESIRCFDTMARAEMETEQRSLTA